MNLDVDQVYDVLTNHDTTLLHAFLTANSEHPNIMHMGTFVEYKFRHCTLYNPLKC